MAVNGREIDREFQDLTAYFERVNIRSESQQVRKSVLLQLIFVDQGATVDKKVCFVNSTQSSPAGLGVFPHGRETDLEELQRQIKELEKHELVLSIALQRSQIDIYNQLINTPTQIGTSQTAKAIPTQLGTQNALQYDRCISIDTYRVNSSNNRHPIKKKNPDTLYCMTEYTL